MKQVFLRIFRFLKSLLIQIGIHLHVGIRISSDPKEKKEECDSYEDESGKE